MEPPPFVPIELGGILNTGLSMKEILLYSGAAIAISAGIGAVICGGKKHSAMIAATKSNDEQMMMQAQGQRRQAAQPRKRMEPNEQQNAQVMQFLEQCIQDAVKYQQTGNHAAAAAAYTRAASVCAETSPQYAIQFQSSALQEYVAAGNIDMARNLLENSPPTGAGPEAYFAHFLQLARFSVQLNDPKTLTYLESAKKAADSGTPNLPHTSFTIEKCRGEYYSAIGQHAEAEKIFRTILESKVEEHKQSGAPELPKEITGIFFEIQKMLILQGRPTKAQEVQTNEIDPLTSRTYDDISYYWHLTHLAYVFVEADYTHFAEEAWSRVLDMYGSKFQEIAGGVKGNRSNFDERVLSIVSNSKNELSVMYYNQGKIALYEELQNELNDYKYQLHTTSKYFDSVSINFVLSKDENDFAVYHIILEVKTRNLDNLFGASRIRFFVENRGQKVEQQNSSLDGPPTNSTLVFKSDQRNSLEPGELFTLFLEVENEDEDQKYSHIQNLFGKTTIAPNTPFSSLVGNKMR